MQLLNSDISNTINQWMNGDYDEQTKDSIQHLLDEKKFDELRDAFYKDLEFGTGGIRGIMGVGPNRINKYTLGRATQGFSNFLKKNHSNRDIKVAIAHDCRNNSEIFARVVANVFSANGICVFLFDELRPTPELSFAIRELDCQGGVMLTASHNPKEYNGYKAYGSDGCQLVSPQDQQVMEEVHQINDMDAITFKGDDTLIKKIGSEIDEKYLEAISYFSVSQESIQHQKNIKIVYSPLHGTGGVMVPVALERLGFENVIPVEEQMVFDGDFPTVEYPNPEEKEALNMALDKAKETDAELVMATDPDADRVGIAIKDGKNKWMLLNGNQTGTLIISYLLEAWKNSNKLTGSEYIVKTVVTSYLIDRIANSYGVDCYNTLTGFKYIGKLMTELESKKQFIAGGEESYGYLIGDHVRDKDAVVSSSIIAEMAAHYKDQGSSLFEALLDIYEKYGLFREKLVSIRKEGEEGSEKIREMMTGFRSNPPKELAGSKVTIIKDFKTSEEKKMETGKAFSIGLPQSNVLQFITEDDSMISVRPSGTEPKIKFYCSVNTILHDKKEYEKLAARLDQKIDAIIDDLVG